MSKRGILVLAAGRSSRMGRNKALLTIDGSPLLTRHLQAAKASGVDWIGVVLGYERETIRNAVDLAGVRVVENPDHTRGQFSSVRVGVAAFRNEPHPSSDRGLFVTPVDCPPVSDSVFVSLLECARARDGAAVIPTVFGHPGHPILLTETGLREVCDAPLTSSLAGVLDAMNTGCIRVETGCSDILWNLNTPADAQRYIFQTSRDRSA